MPLSNPVVSYSEGYQEGSISYPSPPTVVASASFTPTNNSLQIAILSLYARLESGSADFTGVTCSGGGLTWTNRLSTLNQSTAGSGQIIFTAPVTTGASTTLTAANFPTVYQFLSQWQWRFLVLETTGHDVSTPTGATATGRNLGPGSVTITLSSSPSTNSIVVASRNVNHATFSGENATEGAGWTELSDQINDGQHVDVQSQYRGSSTSTSVTWATLVSSGTTPTDACEIAIELMMAAAATKAPPPFRKALRFFTRSF